MQHLKATFEAQFMKKLSKTEVELKKNVANKKKACRKTDVLQVFCFALLLVLLKVG